MTTDEQAMCRDCLHPTPAARCCVHCGKARLVAHPELHSLTLAHIDCDAFYASIEKRDNPGLRDKPVIVGGGRRGVVSAACYIARISGVHSAMPMFKALKACPDAVVIRPNMEKYAAASREVRKLMLELTPLVEPISIDEAFLDLAGTEKLHRHSAAESLAGLALRIERELDITVSIGLSFNKFLAKVASDLDKPRGFSVIGQAEALSFLAQKPVGIIWGVGKVLQAKLAEDGVRSIGQLQVLDLKTLLSRYGSMGQRLHELAHARDRRKVTPEHEAKSISGETTFNDDISGLPELERSLWLLSEKVSRRAKASGHAGRTVTLKLKTADFHILTRRTTLHEPTRLAERIFKAALPLLQSEARGRAYRLLGVGLSDLCDLDEADHGDLLDVNAQRQVRMEEAIDRMRARFGKEAVIKGRALPSTD